MPFTGEGLGRDRAPRQAASFVMQQRRELRERLEEVQGQVEVIATRDGGKYRELLEPVLETLERPFTAIEGLDDVR